MECTKKLRFLIFSFLIINSSLLICQETWVQTYRPFQRQYWTDRYTVEDVLVTQDGGYVVSGGYVLIGEMPSDYERWGFLMKTDTDGNILWSVSDSVDFMSDNGDFVDFVETSDGDFITIGSRIPSGGYMIKRDSQGNRLWEIPYTDFGTKSMSQTADGNIILGGVVNSNIALRKIDNDGNTLWTNSHDCGYVSIANSIKETSSGDYILTGLVSGNGYVIIVLKTDSNGDSLWTRTFDGLGGNDKGHCVIETSEGNIFVSGNLDVPAPDYGYGFLACLEADGDSLWTKIFDDGLFYSIGSLIQTSDNNYVLQGGKLVKIDYNQNVIWNEPLTGDVFGGGDKNLQELQNGGFLCVSVEDYGDHITLNKTDSQGQVSAINHDEIPYIDEITLSNYPNPFNPETKISFNLPSNIKNPIIEIFNIKGEKVRIINCQNQIPIIWDGTDNFRNQVSSGIYFYRLKANNFVSKAKKMTLLK